MLRTSLLAVGVLLSLSVTACAHRAAKDTPTAQLAKTPAPQANCVTTGTRIPRKAGECGAMNGRSYSRDDIERTGRIQGVGAALKSLDPALH
jgi:hypothetical protein